MLPEDPEDEILLPDPVRPNLGFEDVPDPPLRDDAMPLLDNGGPPFAPPDEDDPDAARTSGRLPMWRGTFATMVPRLDVGRVQRPPLASGELTLGGLMLLCLADAIPFRPPALTTPAATATLLPATPTSVELLLFPRTLDALLPLGLPYPLGLTLPNGLDVPPLTLLELLDRSDTPDDDADRVAVRPRPPLGGTAEKRASACEGERNPAEPMMLGFGTLAGSGAVIGGEVMVAVGGMWK